MDAAPATSSLTLTRSMALALPSSPRESNDQGMLTQVYRIFEQNALKTKDAITAMNKHFDHFFGPRGIRRLTFRHVHRSIQVLTRRIAATTAANTDINIRLAWTLGQLHKSLMDVAVWKKEHTELKTRLQHVEQSRITTITENKQLIEMVEALQQDFQDLRRKGMATQGKLDNLKRKDLNPLKKEVDKRGNELTMLSGNVEILENGRVAPLEDEIQGLRRKEVLEQEANIALKGSIDQFQKDNAVQTLSIGEFKYNIRAVQGETGKLKRVVLKDEKEVQMQINELQSQFSNLEESLKSSKPRRAAT